MDRKEELSPLGRAIAIVSQLFVVSLMMFLPALAGAQLDKWLGTSFLSVLCLVFGVVGGFYYLLQVVGVGAKRQD